jgi:biopolymer transport protein ExbD
MALIRGRQKKSGAQIFTASMADIVFLLIVFFVLTYNVEKDRTQVQLPKTNVRIEVPKDEKLAIISIASPEDGQVIRVSTGEEMSLPVSSDEEIVTFASNVVAANPQQKFVIKADKSVEYERVDAVLDALKQAKAKVIFLLSDQKTVGDS